MNEISQEPLRPPRVSPVKQTALQALLPQFIFALAIAAFASLYHACTQPTIVGVWESQQQARHMDTGRFETVVLRYEFKGNLLRNAGTGLFTARQIRMPFEWQAAGGNGIKINYHEKSVVPVAQIELSNGGDQMQIGGEGIHFRGVYTRKR